MNENQPGQVQLPAYDVEVLEEVADCAIHFARHGRPQAGIAVIRSSFAYGFEAVPVICERLAIKAIKGMWLMPGCHAVTKPIWPTAAGRIFVEADQITPPARWAGRYIAARSRGDYAYSVDLIEAVPRYHLTASVEALLHITVLWINLAEQETR